MSNRTSREEWKNLVASFESSGENLTLFCKKNGLASSTFRHHVKKHSVKDHQKPEERSKFYPLVSSGVKSDNSYSTNEISLELPHGIRLIIKG